MNVGTPCNIFEFNRDTQMNAAMYGVSDSDIDALAHYAAQR